MIDTYRDFESDGGADPGDDVPTRRRVRAHEAIRRLGYGLLAFPLGLLTIPLTLVGGGQIAARAQRRLAAVTPDPVPSAHHRAKPASLLVHAVATLPATALALVLWGFAAWVLVLNLPYPMRDFSWWALSHPFSATDVVGGAWGGPTLAGAWAVHAGGAVLLAVVLSLPVGWLTRLHARSVVRRLGA
ncbi:MAG: hypothetical protein ACRDQA_24360 [Nocardioidaceae bacterium]